jgi:DNA-binding beta-propeller fold protein YncE
MKRYLYGGVTLLVLAAGLGIGSKVLGRPSGGSVVAPRFEVDPFWPKPLPNHWRIGMTIGVSVDAQDHVWVIHRPKSIVAGELHAESNPPASECCVKGPPVIEFDKDGNVIGHWGGPGQGYDWPISEHGITVDYKGNVWVGGNGGVGSDPEYKDVYHDNQILKFTQSGKFLLQIGKPKESKGSNDTENVKGVAQVFVDPKTNEAYVADGYGNHRVIVYDADTGKYKRHWGAYGKRPDDANLGKYNPDAAPSQQFANPVHCVVLSNDNLLYVCDRVNDRIQVFNPDGTFVKEVFIAKKTLGAGSAWEIAFSKDPQQKYIYLTDGENEKVYIMDRASMEVLTSFGDGGRIPGEFFGVHSIAVDSKGNIYTTETFQGQRIQKFVYKGMAPVTQKDQGVIWPGKKS